MHNEFFLFLFSCFFFLFFTFFLRAASRFKWWPIIDAAAYFTTAAFNCYSLLPAFGALLRYSAVATVLTARLWEARVNCGRREAAAIVFLPFSAHGLLETSIVEFFIQGSIRGTREFLYLELKRSRTYFFGFSWAKNISRSETTLKSKEGISLIV